MASKKKEAALSAVRSAGDFLFVSGQVPTDINGSIIGKGDKIGTAYFL